MINYLLEVTFYQFLLLAVYHVGFKRYTFFQVNRFFLLFSLAISFVIPFLSIPDSLQQTPIMLPEIVLYAGLDSPVEIVERTAQTWNLNIVFFVGLLIFTSLLVFRLVKLFRLISSNPKKVKDNFTLVTLQNENEVFSWFNYVFAHNDKLSEETVSHELVHIKNRHSIDILFLEIVQVILWFSPVVRWYKHELQLVHEYQADSHAVKESVSSYAKLLVNELFQVNELSMVHNFWKVNQIKSRIKMLKKMKTQKIKSLRYLLVIPLLAMFTMEYSCTRQGVNNVEKDPICYVDGKETSRLELDNINPDDIESMSVFKGEGAINKYGAKGKNGVIEVITKKGIESTESEVYNFQVVDQQPQIIGVDQNLSKEDKYMVFQRAIMKHVKDNFKYPEQALKDTIQGRVIIQFIFGEDGKVEEATVVKGVNEELDDEALRIVNLIPDVTPAYHNGKPVAVSFMLPITFKLQ